MSSDDMAILVSNLSKCYQIYGTPRDRLKQFILPRLERLAGLTPKQYFREFWALREVSFQIKKGETVGIIGRNGSGKSTLLHMICGTLSPTRGRVESNGRIAALLELGSGFNPEFTGRENVYMYAAVLGLHKEEVDERFAAIAAFAEIGPFVEEPVRTYSSGMIVRLAFAVAINVDPEILIVDEALAVGDELFQRKCFSRIEAIRATGATILLVSHSGATVVELCDRALLLDDGELLASDATKVAVGKYQRLLYAPNHKRAAIRAEILEDKTDGSEIGSKRHGRIKGKAAHTSGTAGGGSEERFDPHLVPKSTIAYDPSGAVISTPRISNQAGSHVNCLVRGNTYRYTYDVVFTRSVTNVRFGMLIKTQAGVELGGGASAASFQSAIPYIEAESAAHVEFSFQCNLNQGLYFLNAGVVGVLSQEETYLHRVLDAYAFRVMPDGEGYSTGIVDFKCTPEIIRLTRGEKRPKHE